MKKYIIKREDIKRYNIFKKRFTAKIKFKTPNYSHGFKLQVYNKIIASRFNLKIKIRALYTLLIK